MAGNQRYRPVDAAPLVTSFLDQLHERVDLATFLRGAGSRLGRRYGASEIVLAVRHAEEPRGFLWRCRKATADHAPFEYSEPRSAEMAAYFSGPHGDWLLSRVDKRHGWRFLPRATEEVPLRPNVLKLVGMVAGGRSLSRLVSVEIPPVGNSSGRLFLVDPSIVGGAARTLNSIARLVRQVGPALLAQHQTRALRTRAQMAERGRIARELHDGVIPSLLGLKMRVHILRRHVSHAATLPELDDIERQLHEQVVALRELTETSRAAVEPSQLLAHLTAQVERFRRETRIAAAFESDVEEVQIRPWMCHEIVLVVQEALTNIKRHSGAASVRVRLSARRGSLKLIVDDDGRGFPFNGRQSLDELEMTLQGPLVIKERVRALGGTLTIESTPRRGSRLEIEIPVRSTLAFA